MTDDDDQADEFERDFHQEYKDDLAQGHIYPDGTQRDPDPPDPDEAYVPYARERRVVSEAGREALARAVSLDHDWALRFSGEDKLAEVVGGMSRPDLEAADLLAYYLRDAIGCALIARDREAREAAAAQEAGEATTEAGA